MAVSSLTPLQLSVSAGMLQNRGLGINVVFTNTVVAYESLPSVASWKHVVTTGSGVLSNSTITTLQRLSGSICPPFTDSFEPPMILNGVGYTGNLMIWANEYMGNGDLSKFAQYFSQAYGYVIQTNTMINSSLNSQSYLGPTFNGMTNMISSDITAVNLATQAFGQDLQNLGNLINLNNLDNLGSPLALAQQVYAIADSFPVLSIAFLSVGIDSSIVLNLTNPTVTVSDDIQQLMYLAMKQITGDPLKQVLSLLGVKTTGIETMADLLNPVKLFPTSFQSLTTTTLDGPRAIYTNSSGAVNSNLSTQLPPYALRSTA
jgi:hypothetical protein